MYILITACKHCHVMARQTYIMGSRRLATRLKDSGSVARAAFKGDCQVPSTADIDKVVRGLLLAASRNERTLGETG